MNWELRKAEMESAPLILLIGDPSSAYEIQNAVKEKTAEPFHLAVAKAEDWNRDLSPWPAEAVFRGSEPFAGEADRFLNRLIEEVLTPLTVKPVWTGLAGYSLAGLFALYAMYQTSRFQRIASVSGSLWYPEFLSFCRTHTPCEKPQAVYLSVGDAEKNTRHPFMKTVQDCTESLHAYYAECGYRTVLELNPGNHFHQETERLVRAVSWILKDTQEPEESRSD